MTTQLEVAVPAVMAGERLDRFVGGLQTVGSRAEAERLVREGRVLVDGRPRPKSYRLEGNEVVSLDLPGAARVAPRARAARSRHRLRGREPARRRQAGGTRRPSVGGSRERDAGPRSARASGSLAARSPNDRGSSTGSTATRPASSWSRATRRHTGDFSA